jgi:hypothetical protein
MGEAHHGEQRSATEAEGNSSAVTQSGFLPLTDLKARIHNALTNPTSSAPAQPLAPLVTVPSASTEIVREEAPFSLLGSPAARWFEPDTNQVVSMRVNLTNAPTGASTAVQSALNALTGVSGSSFRFQNGGSTSSGGMSFDGVNAISFGDPRGQIDPPTNCSGVLAIGGYYRSGTTTTVINGQTYYKILEGDLTFADGWTGCGFYENPANVAEVATHELGHVLGLGHSADTDATMYAYAHFDGRGAAIRADDIAGLRSIYPGSTPPPSCTYTVTSSVAVGATASSNNTVTVTPSSSSCAWTAISNASWITITAGASGTGNGSATFSVAANTSSQSRSGTLTVAGRTVTVNQAGASAAPSCSYTVSNQSFSVNASSTLKNVTVTTSSGTCSWSSSSNVSWITITTGASVVGNGVGSFTVAANTSSLARTGTVTIAGKTVTITQSGKTRRKAR